MRRIKSYRAIAAVIIPVLLIDAAISTYINTPRSPGVPVSATSTLSVLPTRDNLTPILGNTPRSLKPKPATVATVTPQTTSKPAPEPVSSISTTSAASVSINPTVAPIIRSSIGLDATAKVLRNAIVNILCIAPAGSGLRSISGSGVIIDPKGIILTNAHIAQYFLFPDRGVVCHIRNGSPATDQYSAGLLYLPTAWIQANASLLTEANPTGTGEYDFALLGITKSVTATPLPSAFPSIPLAVIPASTGAQTVIGSYGAQFLDVSQINSDLFPTLVFGSIKDIYTFATNSVDVLALGGSAAAQEGSSGGGVASASGELIGVITTSTMEGDTSTRELHAITTSYIRAEYMNESDESLTTFLMRSLSGNLSAFAPKAVQLRGILNEYLH